MAHLKNGKRNVDMMPVGDEGRHIEWAAKWAGFSALLVRN